MEEPYTAITAWHFLHLLVISLVLGHTLLWDGIPFFNQHFFQVSQCDCVGHSGMNSTPKLTPEVFNGIEVRTAGRPSHPLLKPNPVGVSIVVLEGRILSYMGLPLVAESHLYLCIEITSNEEMPCFSSEGDAAPHHLNFKKHCYNKEIIDQTQIPLILFQIYD